MRRTSSVSTVAKAAAPIFAMPPEAKRDVSMCSVRPVEVETGGACVRDVNGALHLIDLKEWPS